MALGDPDYVRGVLSGAGFTGIAIEPTRFHVIGKSAASEAELAGLLGPSGRLLEEKEADDATRRAIVSETEAAFATYAGGPRRLRGEPGPQACEPGPAGAVSRPTLNFTRPKLGRPLPAAEQVNERLNIVSKTTENSGFSAASKLALRITPA
jgi:hypothetical protein